MEVLPYYGYYNQYQGITCKFCSTTFMDPFGMAKLSHHFLTIHLDQNPEIHCYIQRAPPCGSSKANSIVKRRLEIDCNSSKKRKMDHSVSLEQFFLRFPTLEEKICNQLDQQSLITFTKVSKEMMDIRLGRRFYWVRNIEYQLRGVYKGKIPKRKRDLWRKVIQRSPVEIVKEIFQMTAQFYKFSKMNKNGMVKCSPLHIAAERGNLKICQHIIDRFDDKNPKDLKEETPLHWAASKNHFEVCKLILENVSDRNPKDVRQITPLHMAASAENLELCKLILVNESEKNPRDKKGNTPLHEAASGSFDICKLILDDVSDKNPKDIIGLTPLHQAAIMGQFKIVKLIMESIDEKSPVDDEGDTPLHYAADAGHFDMCDYMIKKLTNKSPLNNIGKTPKDIASEKGHNHLFSLF